MSTYQEAQDRFDENCENIGLPIVGVSEDEDVLGWNLNTGLSNLARAIQDDLARFRVGVQEEFDDMRTRLDRLEDALRRRR